MPTIRTFQFSTTVTFVIEIGDFYMRFFASGQLILDGVVGYALETPFAEADVDGLRFHQINDVVFITHPNYWPQELVRVADDEWIIQDAEFIVPPMLAENLTETTLKLSAPTGTGVTMESSSPLFVAGHVGSYWRIGYKRSTGLLNVALAGDVESNGYKIFGSFVVRSFGTWECDIILQKKDSADQWQAVRTWHGEADWNFDTEIEADEVAEYRLVVDNFVAATDARVEMQWEDSVIYGLAKVTAVTDSTHATVDIVAEMYTEPTWTFADQETVFWAEGAWSTYRGFPRVVTSHEQRLFFGGTAFQPATWWISRSGGLDDFEYGLDDSDAFTITLAARELNAIQWAVSQRDLVFGTTGAEWVLSSGDGVALTPTSFQLRQQSEYGSEYQPAIIAGDAILFVERKGRKIRELIYTENAQKFQAADLTLFSEHLTASGIKQIAWQSDARILWVVTNDGQALGLTYQREQGVVGWHRHDTNGEFLAVTTSYGAGTAPDEVWFIVDRSTDDTDVLTVERFNPAEWTEREDAFFVDSGVTIEGSPANEFTAAVPHLAGRTVVALADGVVYENLAVDEDGTVTLPIGVTASKIHIGLPFEYEVSPFRFDSDAVAGVHVSRFKRLARVHARFLNSAGVEFLDERDNQRDVEFDDPAGLNTGDVSIDCPTSHSFDPEFRLKGSKPLPMTLVAIVVDYTISSTP